MFVLLSKFNVAHYNAQQCKDIIMPVPIHAAVMLGHALGARMSKPVQGVALIVHDARVEQEWLPKPGGKFGDRLLANKRGATAFYVERSKNGGGYASSSMTPAAMSYQMHATANGCFSLALDFGEADVTVNEVQAQLRVMRFAGGAMHKLQRIETALSESELLSHIRSGYLVMDACDRAEHALAAGQEPAHVFLHKHRGGYVVPAVVGYHLITDLSLERKGIRQSPDIPLEGHAFAESITGLIEFQHVNRYKFSEPTVADDSAEEVDISSDVTDYQRPPTSLFWHHHWTPDQRSFLIQQAPQL